MDPRLSRDANRDGAAFGDGVGYRYPHAYAEHWVEQQYLPSALQGEVFWQPGQLGWEGERRDRMAERRAAQLAAAAEYRALEYGQVGQPTPWDNPANQHRGQIVPGKPYQQNGTYCRPFTHTIYISGSPETARGTACRQPDGTWRTVG